jgi:hypothetical protein
MSTNKELEKTEIWVKINGVDKLYESIQFRYLPEWSIGCPTHTETVNKIIANVLKNSGFVELVMSATGEKRWLQCEQIWAKEVYKDEK